MRHSAVGITHAHAACATRADRYCLGTILVIVTTDDLIGFFGDELSELGKGSRNGYISAQLVKPPSTRCGSTVPCGDREICLRICAVAFPLPWKSPQNGTSACRPSSRLMCRRRSFQDCQPSSRCFPRAVREVFNLARQLKLAKRRVHLRMFLGEHFSRLRTTDYRFRKLRKTWMRLIESKSKLEMPALLGGNMTKTLHPALAAAVNKKRLVACPLRP